ncbi:MAG: hypothetical protein AMJ92_10180 [candidate division Zixibacteria bacterium SM23_81]|nr:MAG: hypothetical protein AMJ92_10180 [candidate division Zixibacteria bacterium SM23_81]
MKKPMFSVVPLLILCFILVFYGYSKNYSKSSQPAAVTKGPAVEIDGIKWTQVLYWDFANGSYPSSWGWGDWDVVDGILEGQDPDGSISVYFFPFDHDANFILETKVQFIQKTSMHDVEAQLLTRDSRKLNYESGMVLFAKENNATVRHMANKIDYVYETFRVDMEINYREWYVMKFMVYNGLVKAFVNDVQVYISNNSFPVGTYHEPHLAVKSGMAKFEYVKILTVK